jgi:hypothetical protein
MTRIRSEPDASVRHQPTSRWDPPCESLVMDKLRTACRPEQLWVIRAALIDARHKLSVSGPATLDFACEKAEIDAALMLIDFEARASAH